MTNSNVP